MKKIVSSALLILSAAMLFFSCAPPVASIAMPEERAVDVLPPPVQVTVATNKPVYVPGEIVTMTLTAKNTSTRAVTLNFTSSQRFDFIVTYQGRVLWKWSADKAFLAVTGSITLAPGKSVTYRAAEYKAQVPPYGITAPEYTFDLSGLVVSVPAISGKTQFKVSRYIPL